MKYVYMGMDASKEKCEVTAIDQRGNSLTAPFTITPDEAGIDQLLTRIEPICKTLNATPIFGMEATGIYHLPIYVKLEELNYHVKVYNALELRAFRNKNIRKTKTDRIDALIIAEMLRFEAIPHQRQHDPATLELRELCRARYRIVKKIANTKKQINRNIDTIFRGYNEIFDDLYTKTSLHLLKKYTTPRAIEKLGLARLTKILKKQSHGHLGEARAQELIAACQKTITPSYMQEPSALETRYLIEQLDLLETQLKDIEKRIEEKYAQFDQHIATIPGIGTISAAVIQSEIGNIEDFNSPEQIVAYAGLDPTVRQSGEYTSTKHKISKRGSPILRHALYMAATTAWFHNPVCQQIYERKKKEKLHHKSAICVVARKLTHIIYSVMKNKKPFQTPNHILLKRNQENIPL